VIKLIKRRAYLSDVINNYLGDPFGSAKNCNIDDNNNCDESL
jgi:hypothetical protein